MVIQTIICIYKFEKSFFKFYYKNYIKIGKMNNLNRDDIFEISKSNSV